MDVKEARQKLTHLLKNHAEDVLFTEHALERMLQRGITKQDVLVTLKNRTIVPPPQSYQRSLRFKVQDLELIVIFAFDGPFEAAVITVWREQ